MFESHSSMHLIINPSEQQKSLPISPPTPLTPSSSTFTSNPAYSLFDNNPNNRDWLSASSTPLLRKHSVNVDGKDFPSPSAFNWTTPADYWRRSSAPNVMSYVPNVCTNCLNSQSQVFSPSCGQHRFCQSCLNSQSAQQLVLQGICPACAQTKLCDPTTSDYFLSSPPASTYSNATSTFYPCVKLTNVPWDVSQNDVRTFFSNCRSPSASVCTQSIHIMMDRTTGKTLSDAYVEFASVSDMHRAIETKNQKPLKGRIVSVTESCQEELLRVVFPKWRGQFQGTFAVPPPSEVVRTMSTAAGGGSSGCPPFVTREEINSLLVVCKNYKLHFSRKCAERPFENIISVIAKYPWYQTDLISTMHRDHVYEMLKLSIESLKTHLAKDYVQIDSTLLERLVRAGIMCPAFTERQKTTLLQASRIECPQDITALLVSNCNITNVTTDYNNSSTTTTGTPVLVSPIHQSQPTFVKKPTKHTFYQQSNTRQRLAPTSDTFIHPWESNGDVFDSDLFLSSSTNSPISSIIRDIQINCSIDDKMENTPIPKKSTNTLRKPHSLTTNNGIPLLLQPIADLPQEKQQQQQHNLDQRSSKPFQRLSPWAPSFESKLPSNIWRMTTPIESSHHTSSKSLLAA